MSQRLIFAVAVVIGLLLAYEFGGDVLRYIRMERM